MSRKHLLLAIYSAVSIKTNLAIHSAPDEARKRSNRGVCSHDGCRRSVFVRHPPLTAPALTRFLFAGFHFPSRTCFHQGPIRNWIPQLNALPGPLPEFNCLVRARPAPAKPVIADIRTYSGSVTSSS